MTYNFGKDITRKFIPYEDEQPIALLSQAPQIFLYSAQPTLSQAATGSGAIGGSYTVAYWADTAPAPFAKTYTIPAIPDPSPTSNTPSRGYWEAINFVLKSGGQTQTVVRQFDVERTAETDSFPTITTTDLTNVYPAISAYLSTGQMDAFIVIALQELKIDLDDKGYKWTDLFKLDKLTLAAAYKTISLCALSQIKERDDRFELRFKIFSDRYDTIMSKTKLLIDTDGDNSPDEEAPAQPNYMIVTR